MNIKGKPWDPHKRPLVADGAWGTELIRRGLSQGEPSEKLNLSNSEMVAQLAADYSRAGSDIVLTNTFNGNRIQLGRHDLAEKCYEINKKGAEITAEAVANAVIVAGDIGPSGKLVLMGEIGEDELFEAFAEQAKALHNGGAEWIVIETMTDLQEMSIAVKAVKASVDIPVVASMSYEFGKNGYRTIMGNSPRDCYDTLIQLGIDVIGANCGTGIDTYVDLAKELCSFADIPVWIKANAGLPELKDGQVIFRMTPAQYAEYVPQLLEAGVSIIGGCCGTHPDFIREIRKIVDKEYST